MLANGISAASLTARTVSALYRGEQREQAILAGEEDRVEVADAVPRSVKRLAAPVRAVWSTPSWCWLILGQPAFDHEQAHRRMRVGGRSRGRPLAWLTHPQSILLGAGCLQHARGRRGPDPTPTRLTGPSPSTWYARWIIPLRA